MLLARPRLAPDPRSCTRRFGRGPARVHAVAFPAAEISALSDEVKLFATTFAAGFLFVTCLIA